MLNGKKKLEACLYSYRSTVQDPYHIQAHTRSRRILLDTHTSQHIYEEHPKTNRNTTRSLERSEDTSGLYEETPARKEIATRPKQVVFFSDGSNSAAPFLHFFVPASEGKGRTHASSTATTTFAICGFEYHKKSPILKEGNWDPVPEPRPGQLPGQSRPPSIHRHEEEGEITAAEQANKEEEEAHSPRSNQAPTSPAITGLTPAPSTHDLQEIRGNPSPLAPRR